MITCVIPARMGSTRFPGKPLHKILGKELILHVCKIASRCSNIDHVVVATEDQEIYDVVKSDGYDCKITEPCSTCTHRVSSLVNTLDYRPDYIVNLQGDEPCMSPSDIDWMVDYTVQNKHKMTKAVYEVSEEDILDEDCVKAVVNNGHVIWLVRKPEMEAQLLGIAGLYVYDYETIANFRSYDLKAVEACNSLDTIGFIGKVPVGPFKIPRRTQAVDRLSDVEEVTKFLSK